MDRTPLVSIIIPAYNAGRFIERSVACALGQTYEHIQVIVVDDGSTDDTAARTEALCESDGRITLVQHDANRGRLEARRTGIQAARGELALFLDADDELAPNMAERLVSEQAGRFDIVQCDFEIRYEGYASDDERRFNRRFNRPPATTAHGDDVTHLVFRERRTTWSLCGKLMRTSLLKQAVSYIGESTLTQAEDACLFFIVSCLADSYKGVPSLKGYIYNMDAGSSDARWKSMTLEQFGYTCRYVDAMDLIGSFLEQTGRAEALGADYRTVRYEHVRAVADKLLHVVERDARPTAYAQFTQMWPAVEAVAGISEAGWGEGADSWESIATSEALACSARPIRTVGAFNYQMHVGGAERVAAALVKLWHDQGLRVVFFAEEPREHCAYELPDDIVWVELPPAEQSGPGNYEQRARAIQAAVREHEIDVFVSHQWWSDLLAWDMMLIKTLNVPYCLYCHNLFEVLFLEANEGDFDCSRLFRYLDGLVVLTGADERFWKRFVPRVWKTNNPATFEPVPMRKADDGKSVLWVGRLTAADKQPQEALEIMARAMGQDARLSLTLVGASDDERDFAQTKALAERLGIAQRIRFIDTSDNLSALYADASMLLVTSRHESWCLVLAEAKAHGLPCVMYELPYLTLAEGARGILSAPQGDRDGAARAVLKLAADAELRDALGCEALAHARELSSFDLAAFWEGVFGELAQGSPARNDFANADLEWDLLVDGLKASVRKASDPRLRTVVKRKGYEIAREIWHRIRR